MIVLDIETTGLSAYNCGIWQIGAIDLKNPSNYFLEEARIDDSDIIHKGALVLSGKDESYLRDIKKQSQKELILSFFSWIGKVEEKIFIGQNILWDISFIVEKMVKYGIFENYSSVLGHRGIDLHSVAALRYKELYGVFKLKENGLSMFGLDEIMKFCGLKEDRKRIEGLNNYVVVFDGECHGALWDCVICAEVYFRLVEGRTFFEEFKEFEIPDYLRRK